MAVLHNPVPQITGPLKGVTIAFERWLHLPDRAPLYAMLGTIAANKLPGDPVWLGLIAPPSSAKTELLNAVMGLPDIYEAATLTPASLLSGTPRKERSQDASGGLLRKVGDFGILIAKDFTSVLAMRPDTKSELLAAMRELYDGRWTRQLGTDGGRTLTWQGKLGFLFGCTEAIDDHHGVMSELGARFILCRMPTADQKQLAMARKHTGARTAQMRRELAEAVQTLFAQAPCETRDLTEPEWERLEEIAWKAVRLRSAVVRDRRTREIEAVHGNEGPARLGLTLERIMVGLLALGVESAQALSITERLAKDSVPLIRRRALDYLETLDMRAETSIIAQKLGLPTGTTRRALEELAAHGLAKRYAQGEGKSDLWESVAT